MAKKKKNGRTGAHRHEVAARREREQTLLHDALRTKSKYKIADVINEMDRRLQDELIRTGVRVSHEALERANVIDLQDLVKKSCDDPAFETELKRKMRILADEETARTRDPLATSLRRVTPCFPECVVKLNTWQNGEVLYVHDVRTTETSVSVVVDIFSTPIETKPSVLASALIVRTAVTFGTTGNVVTPDGGYVKADDAFVRLDHAASMTPREIYDLVQPERLSDDPTERAIWRKITPSYVDRVMRNFGSKRDDVLLGAVTAYVYAMKNLNYFLDTATVSRPRRPAGETGARAGSPEHVVELDLNADERRVRTVGPVRVESPKPPRLVTARTMTTYRTAAWHVRGHVRHYKSGKTAYIAPQVKRRRGIETDANVRPRPVDIRVRVPEDPVERARRATPEERIKNQERRDRTCPSS